MLSNNLFGVTRKVSVFIQSQCSSNIAYSFMQWMSYYRVWNELVLDFSWLMKNKLFQKLPPAHYSVFREKNWFWWMLDFVTAHGASMQALQILANSCRYYYLVTFLVGRMFCAWNWFKGIFFWLRNWFSKFDSGRWLQRKENLACFKERRRG